MYISVQKEDLFMSKAMTRSEKSWILYDVANSAFILFATAVIPVYFAALAPDKNVVVSWGYAETISSLVVALLMPVLGYLADYQGNKLKFFMGFLLTGVVACLVLSLPLHWLAFLVVYVITSIGLNSSITFYDAMIVDVTEDEHMDRISSHGYAWGYIGSCVPFIVCIALIFMGPKFLGIDTMFATRMCFIIVAAWWLLFSIPLIKNYRQVHFKEKNPGELISTFSALLGTVKKIVHNRPMFIYMLAYFFYIDGVHAVIKMATSYGAQLGISSNSLILALLVTQFVAFPAAILYARLSHKIGTLRAIMIAVLAYLFIVLFAAFFLQSAREFWFLAILVGLFQGGIQALSRSYFGKLVPKKNSNEFYGFFQILGKYSAVIGTFLVASITQLTGNTSLGILSIAMLFIVGFALLLLLPKYNTKPQETI